MSLQSFRAKLAEICDQHMQKIADTIGEFGPGSIGEARLVGRSEAFHHSLRLLDEYLSGGEKS